MSQREDKMVEEFIAKMMEGDSRCPIPIDAIVEKANSEEGDYHQDGTMGRVVGNIYSEEMDTSGYLVQFNDFQHHIFVAEFGQDRLKPRLKRIL